MLPAFAALRFDSKKGGFNVWHTVEDLLGIMLAAPDVSAADRQAAYDALDSVRGCPDPSFAKQFEGYNAQILALEPLQRAQRHVEEAVNEDGAKYEYPARIRLIAAAAAARCINQGADAALDAKLDGIIEAETAAVREPRLLKFSAGPKAKEPKTPVQKAADPVVRIPKKLAAVFDTLRGGDIENGLAALDAVAGFEPQKAAAKAETAYFQSDFARGMDWDEQMFPHANQWYACNPYTEHLAAYAAVAPLCGQTARALETVCKMRLGHYEQMMLQKLKGGTCPCDVSLPVLEDGRSMDDLLAQMKKAWPKYTPDDAKGANYLLHFLFAECKTADAPAY